MVVTPEREYAAFARAALPRYGFGARAHVELLSLSENGTFLISEGARRLVLRVHRPGYHTRTAIESELTWMQRIREDCGIATPVVIPALSGEAVTTVEWAGERREVDAVSVIDGRTGEECGCPVPYEELGRISALMHLHAEHWPLPDGFERFRWDFESSLGPAARWGRLTGAPGVERADNAVLAGAVASIERALRDYGSGRDRFGLVHADLRMANIMVDARGGITVIDFDDCGFGWYLSDLGSVVSWVEHEAETPDIVARWLRGYRPVRPLGDEDLGMIRVFVMMRRLMLTAWLGTHPASPPAKALGTDYGRGTGALAARFLDDPDWFRFGDRALAA
ncbi:phosphotransferase enzyme family protein [Raineyella sp. LH-20]|uniref:phosphotransferase enzyme family protein n=1 Tax=Raineyella sp. LH-20 TaxID=3081204 RepID=UPI0029549937|nr:phosphotransferase [Raineyella sp. LH-20]WOP17517.1 phosphotransferase [Raineyella sp. LH-20]